MRQQTSKAIVLRRTNYGEADRIVTFLTPIGKVRAMVKGVRRSKSKLAGGIELFSESTITFLQTQGDLRRIVSTRLDTHWDAIVGDLQRMMFGYEAMKLLDSIVEDEADRDYYDLLKLTLEALADLDVSEATTQVWFYIRLLKALGREPNLKTDHLGKILNEQTLFTFSMQDMCFAPSPNGNFRSEHIKLLRFGLSQPPQVLKQIKHVDRLSAELVPILKSAVDHST